MKICMVGDSITRGSGDSEKGGHADRLKQFLEPIDYSFKVYNMGISGNTTTDVLERMEVEIKQAKAELICIAIGINDSSSLSKDLKPIVSLEQYQENLQKIHSIAKNQCQKIIYIGLTSVDEAQTAPKQNGKYFVNKQIEQFDEMLMQHCKMNNAAYISLKEVITQDDLYDGLHPNSQGHEKIFQKVKNFLLERQLLIIPQKK